MTKKTRTRVVIERHERTIIRSSSSKITAKTAPLPPERPVQEKRKLLGRWWKTAALKSATALAPLARRLKRGVKVEKMKTLNTSGPRPGTRTGFSLDRD
jgi:hypothetical protein